MGILRQWTKIDNKIDLQIGFVVDGGICPLRGLRAGKSRSVSLSRILEECRNYGSAEWAIRVLIDGRDSGILLHPRLHILEMTRIVFRYRWAADASRIPIAEGVKENFRDRIFNSCINWDNKIFVEIAEADKSWSNRHGEVDTMAATSIRLENNPVQSSFASGTISSPTLGLNSPSTVNTRINQRDVDGGIEIPTSVLISERNSTESRRNSTGPVSGRKNSKVPVIKSGKNSTEPVLESERNSSVPVERRHRPLSRRTRVVNPFVVFCAAFILAAGVKILTKKQY